MKAISVVGMKRVVDVAISGKYVEGVSKYVEGGGVERINGTMLPVVGMKRVDDLLVAPCPETFFR